MAHFTKIYRHETYLTISSTSPINSQAGRTVLITGASGGLGSATAHAFMNAHAEKLILSGRKLAKLADTVKRLEAARPPGCPTKLIAYESDIGSLASIEALWKTLAKDGIAVDVLLLNAADTWIGPVAGSSEKIWALFETNVLANLRMSDKFLTQGPENGKVLLYTSSVQMHMHPLHHQPAYAASKAAATQLFQHMANEFKPEQVQIITFHPGAVLTGPARAQGLTEDSLRWDNENLPADFAVWASTTAASFLHGRFVWATWDVAEMLTMKEKILAQPGFLKVGVQGVEIVSMDLFVQIVEKDKKEKAEKGQLSV